MHDCRVCGIFQCFSYPRLTLLRCLWCKTHPTIVSELSWNMKNSNRQFRTEVYHLSTTYNNTDSVGAAVFFSINFRPMGMVGAHDGHELCDDECYQPTG